jgi:hypothetical protein
MKLFSLTLAFYVLALAFLPSFNILQSAEKMSSCKKTCCQMINNSEKKQTEEKNNNDCSKRKCTPFFGCGKTHVVVQKISTFKVQVFTLKQTFNYQTESALSLYIAEHWQPPKVV